MVSVDIKWKPAQMFFYYIKVKLGLLYLFGLFSYLFFRHLSYWLDRQGPLYCIHLHNLMQSNTTSLTYLHKDHNVQFLLTLLEMCKFDLLIDEVIVNGLDYYLFFFFFFLKKLI